MAEESRDSGEIANVPCSSACKSSTSTSNNVNQGTQGDVVTGVMGHYIRNVGGNVVFNDFYPTDSYKSKVIRDIVQNMSTATKGYAGMDSHLHKMLSDLDISNHKDVRIIGICGMGGIGKTTIAQVVCETVRPQFEGYSFLRNVREVFGDVKQGVVHLKEKLISDLLEINVKHTESTLRTKRVLIIFDDVDQYEQLEALCDREWFGPGSRIIVTSRDEHLLNAFEVDKVYRVNPLNEVEALQLFRMKAFKKDHELISEEFLKLSKEFVKYADGHPLAIEVLGSSVKGKRVKLWSSALDRLKRYHPKGIVDVLKVSYDGLQETEKKVFLDIACFFKGYEIDHVTRILQGDGHCPDIDIEGLIDKSVVTLFGKKLWMHDLIQTMGQEIVVQKYPNHPENRSRLWIPKEIIHMLNQSKATSAIESILLQGRPTKEDDVHSINDSFSNMAKLRLLTISNVKFSGNMKYLSNELQYLEWHECPLDSFPLDFQPDNLVELCMHSSRIKQLWKGKKGWRMLRVINLSGSQYLASTPDFTQVPDLEILDLKDCTNLVEVHPSLGFLKKLIRLDMTNCNSVESIPPFISLESLESLNLSLCSRLKKVPEIEGNMKNLLVLYLGGTSIEKLPPSVKRLTGLTTLNLRDCSKLYEIPENMSCMESLEHLDIGGTAIPDSSFLVGMKNLKSLICRGCKGDAPKSLLSPASLSSLTSLIKLDLSDCNMTDRDIPDNLSSLVSLTELHLSGNGFVRLPESFSPLSNLEILYVRNCRQLESVPKKLPRSLVSVNAEGCSSLTDYPNQIKVLTSVESGVCTVNSLDSSTIEDTKGFTMYIPTNSGKAELLLARNTHTEEELVVRLSPPSPVYLSYIWSALQSQSNSFFFVGTDNEIPEWFGNTFTNNHISILIGDKKWKGVATCAIFSVNNMTANVKFSNYWYKITLETDVVRLEPFVYNRRVVDDNLCLTNYFPSRKFGKSGLNESTVVRARCETNNPYMVIQKCGIRLVYEQDAGWWSTDKWFQCRNKLAVLKSGWLSRGDKCLNWEKFIPSSEEEYSTQVLRKNIESVLPRYLEVLNHFIDRFKFNLSESPAWFSNVVGLISGKPAETWFHLPFQVPRNLHKNKKWMGFAIYASITVEAIAGEQEEDNYRVYFQFTTGGEEDDYRSVIECIRSSNYDNLHLFYIPRGMVPEACFTETSTTNWHISFMTDSSHVEFRTIGVRVVYREDIQGFADTILRCMQKEDDCLKFYNKLLVEKWINLIRLQGAHFEGVSNPKERDSRTRREQEFELLSQRYRNLDWSAPRRIRCDFFGAEISKWKWFMHIGKGDSAEISLPLNLLDDANWLGIAICTFNRLGPEDPNMSVDSAISDSECNVVTCRLDYDDHHMQILIPSKEPIGSRIGKDVTWFLYVPRSDKSFKSWRQCKLARATFSWSSKYLVVQSCALGLVYKKDVERLVHTLTSCE